MTFDNVIRNGLLSVECDTLRCDHLCINDGHQRGHCECKQGQSLQQDGRRCEGSLFIFFAI